MRWDVCKELGPDKCSITIEIVNGFGPVKWAYGKFSFRFQSRWTG